MSFLTASSWVSLPLNAIMKGPGKFDFDQRFEETIAEIAARGHQAALRIYLDFPGKPTGVPSFLIDAGLRMTRYEDQGGGQCPDYRNEDLIAALTEFVGAFGERCDGDVRITYITLGLLGFRGGWHTRPLDRLMADLPAQRKIMTAYTKAFSRTRLLMRFPQGMPRNGRSGYTTIPTPKAPSAPEKANFCASFRKQGRRIFGKRSPSAARWGPRRSHCCGRVRIAIRLRCHCRISALVCD